MVRELPLRLRGCRWDAFISDCDVRLRTEQRGRVVCTARMGKHLASLSIYEFDARFGRLREKSRRRPRLGRERASGACADGDLPGLFGHRSLALDGYARSVTWQRRNRI